MNLMIPFQNQRQISSFTLLLHHHDCHPFHRHHSTSPNPIHTLEPYYFLPSFLYSLYLSSPSHRVHTAKVDSPLCQITLIHSTIRRDVNIPAIAAGGTNLRPILTRLKFNIVSYQSSRFSSGVIPSRLCASF